MCFCCHSVKTFYYIPIYIQVKYKLRDHSLTSESHESIEADPNKKNFMKIDKFAS